MLPSDNAKRMLLQQHLIQRRLTQQLAAVNARQLQTTTMGFSAPAGTAAGALPLSSIRQVAAAAVAVGLGREASLSQGQQAEPLSSSLIYHLLAANQESLLKRRLSEMQQQHRQQQHILLAATQGRIERPTKNVGSAFGNSIRSCTQNDDLLASLHQKAQLHTATGFVLSNAASPTKAVVESTQTSVGGKGQAEVNSPDSRGDHTQDFEQEGAEKSSIKKASATTSGAGGVSRKDTRWREMYEELLTYKAKTGSCTVPRGYPENPRLASWVAEQRKQYKLLKDGRQSSITHTRVEMLNRVEFAWNAQEAAWEKHMRDLKNFRAENGHTHCQLGDPKYPKLGLWVKEQRRHYTLMKQGKQSHMTEARCVELDSVGFCWDTHEATWLERLNELRAFKDAKGNCIVPTNYPENPKLGTWIHHQRRQYKKYKEGKPCHITAERIRALDSLGFVWHPRDKNASTARETGETRPGTVTDLTNLDLRPRKRQRI